MKKLDDILLKYDFVVQALFSIVMSLFAGLYICRVEGYITEGENFIDALKNVGFTAELFIALALLVLSLVYDNYVIKRPIHTLENNRESIITGLLSSLTEALFYSYGHEIDVSSVVQVCDYRKECRTVTYQYNTDRNATASEKLDLYFGDVGEECVRKKSPFFIKTLSREDWDKADKEYQAKVPETLRIIVAKPIFIGERVAAVLEIDIFEETDEARKGGTKEGFVTNTVRIDDLKDALKERGIQKMLGNWANSISLLME